MDNIRYFIEDYWKRILLVLSVAFILLLMLYIFKNDGDKIVDDRDNKEVSQQVSKKEDINTGSYNMDEDAVNKLNEDVASLEDDKEFQNSIKPEDTEDIKSLSKKDVEFSKDFISIIEKYKKDEKYNNGLISKIKTDKISDKGSFKDNLKEYKSIMNKKYECGGSTAAEYVVCMKTVTSTVQNIQSVDTNTLDYIKIENDAVFKNIKQRSDVVRYLDKQSKSNLEKNLVDVIKSIINLEYNITSYSDSVIDDFGKNKLDNTYIESKNEEMRNEYFKDNERLYEVYLKLIENIE